MPDGTQEDAPSTSGPCAGARVDVDSRCAQAERLSQAAAVQLERLREVRRQLTEVSTRREADARVRDRREVAATKEAARHAYHGRLARADSEAAIRESARSWLRELDQMNRQLAIADARADEVARRASELERAVPRMELAADAARIAAEAAQEACLEARRSLAECEEKQLQPVETASHAGPPPGNSAGTRGAAPVRLTSPTPGRRGIRPISLVLKGDRAMVDSIAYRLADETGVDPGRLQLLLLELREQIAARALDELDLAFPDDHPFWGQFNLADARLVALNLAAMGYSFDGKSGWQDGIVPRVREVSVAVSNVGLDPRGHMRAATQDLIESLWQGTSVRVEDYLAGQAPDLDVQELVTCLGPNASRLSDLWDMWGRLRPLLLTPA